MNFISIQQQQGIYADGYEPTIIRTGYETILAQRTSSIFAAAAEQDGKVIAVDEYGITVEYKDGTKEAYQLGKIHGTAAGVTFPHNLTTSLKVGDKFKRGDTISYNSNYFTEDMMTPGQVVWKAGVNAVVMFSDNLDTLEDGSVTSKRLATMLNTQTTEVRSIAVKFDQSVEEMVSLGGEVDLDSILCRIKDPDSGGSDFFDEISRETLEKLSSHTPRAKVVGRVSKIEVFYHGERDDMSDTLRRIAYDSDERRANQAQARGETYYSGQVDYEYRVKGEGLEPGNAIINVYIDHDIPFSVGDKAVVGNQMKTVVSRVMEGTNKTELDLDIDLIFGNTSVEERMVLSPKIIAPASLLMVQLAKHLVGVYRGTTNAKFK